MLEALPRTRARQTKRTAKRIAEVWFSLLRSRLCADKQRSERTVGIIGWIVLGLVAGAIAKAILPGDDPGGIIVTMLIGIVGAVIGGLIASALDIGDLDEFFDIGTWLIAIAGSLLLLVIYRAVVGRRASY
jgi:uncharacterized membrane protein YeaQ/YmgE (transglycosylase-associated protein family)